MSKENPNELKIINKNERLHYRQIINQLKQQLAEKQNTIDEINREFVQAVHDWKALCAEKDKEIESLTNRTNRYENMFRSRINRTGDMQKDIELYVKQLAIQELEKVKEWLEPKYFDYEQINYLSKIIDQQIKELKGEKNDNR